MVYLFKFKFIYLILRTHCSANLYQFLQKVIFSKQSNVSQFFTLSLLSYRLLCRHRHISNFLILKE